MQTDKKVIEWLQKVLLHFHQLFLLKRFVRDETVGKGVLGT